MPFESFIWIGQRSKSCRPDKSSMDNLLVGFYVFGFKSIDNLLFFNPLPNDKILDLSKFKAFADDKIIVTQKSKFSLGGIENIVGKGENSGNQHFPTMFSKAFNSRGVKSQDCVGKSL